MAKKKYAGVQCIFRQLLAFPLTVGSSDFGLWSCLLPG